MTKQHLFDHFKKKYNSVIDSKIITDPTTKLSKGYGFVQFSNAEDSTRAMNELQGSLLKGKPIKVNQGVARNSNTHTGNRNQGG